MPAQHNKILRHLAKTGDYERYLCALLLDAPNPNPLFALIAFNAELGKIREVTSDLVTGEMRLIWWRDAINDLFEGNVKKHPLLEAIASEAIASEARASEAGASVLHRNDMLAMIEARYHDLMADIPAAFKVLVKERRAFVSPFTVACMKALDVPTGRKKDAIGAMLGYDLVGLYRNIPFDFSRARCLIPGDILKANNTTPDKIMADPGSLNSKNSLNDFLGDIGDSLKKPEALGFFSLHYALASWYLTRFVKAGSNPWKVKPRSGRASLLLNLYRTRRKI